MRLKAEAAAKREEIERKELEAENLRNMPVDDSKIVEQMFGFLPEGPGGEGEGGYDLGEGSGKWVWFKRWRRWVWQDEHGFVQLRTSFFFVFYIAELFCRYFLWMVDICLII